MADLATTQEAIAQELSPTLVEGRVSYGDVTRQVSGIVEGKMPRSWYIAFGITSSITLLLVSVLTYLSLTGIGVWGNNQPVGWAWEITDFVFWIGIGHAGTLISAILFLFRQRWRTSINRFAEAMTLFAVACAGIFPMFHVGRPWRVYWLFPVPNTYTGMWPNFRSPLMWDVFAVSTYATVSLLFWYTGLIPDLATLRDRTTSRIKQIIFGVLSWGWRGSARHWSRYELAYLLLAGLSTPLVLSVHTIVSFDFAVSLIPGWHETLFPPYFVAGAIYSGFGMVITLMVIARQWFKLKQLVTMRHLEVMNKVILATGSMVGFSYLTEFFIAWYSGNPYDRYHFLNRLVGPYWWAGWTILTCNALVPQLHWFKRIRTSIPAMFIISILVNIGMWSERFVIIVVSLHRDFLPSSWGYFKPTIIDMATLLGSFGLFLTLFLLFVRFLPMISMTEVKTMLAADAHGGPAPPPAGVPAASDGHRRTSLRLVPRPQPAEEG